MLNKTIIAIDGPAASGKGTLGRRLAAELGYAYLDTGLLYRAAAKRVLDEGASPFNKSSVTTAASHVRINDITSPQLRSEEVSKIAPIIAEIPEVREILLKLQREFASQPPDNAPGAILDGRDIGTVVFPSASIKFFITADVETRAERRYQELKKKGERVSRKNILKDIIKRDQKDSTRNISPLKVATDAINIDTSNLSIDSAFQLALSIIHSRLNERQLVATKCDDNS